MKKGVRALALLVIVAVLVTGFTGCTGAKANDKASANTKKILRIAAAFDFKSAMEGKTLVYENLVKSDMAGNFSGWLAGQKNMMFLMMV